MQSAPVAPTMVANPGPTTNPAAGENMISFKIYMKKTAYVKNPQLFEQFRCYMTLYFDDSFHDEYGARFSCF